MSKEKNLKFIKGFCNIKLKFICQKFDVDASNVRNGKASEHNIDKIKKALDYEIKKLYLEEAKSECEENEQ